MSTHSYILKLQLGSSFRLFAILCIISSINFSACKRPMQSVTATYSSKEYKEDLQQLASILAEKHPKPFAFQSRTEFEDLLATQKRLITDQTKLGEFLWMCRSLVASIACGHTDLHSLGNVVSLAPDYAFPMRLIFINKKLIVLNPQENIGVIQKGKEISSINGIAAEDLVKRIYKRISADGKIEAFKLSRINKYLSEYISFELNFPRRYAIESEGEILQLNASKIIVPPSNPIKSCPQNLCLEIKKDENLAILTLRSFHYYGRQNRKFTKFIDKAFREFAEQNINKLIIDIRDNGGGDPYAAAHLLQYIAKNDFQYYTSEGDTYKDLQKPLKAFEKAFKGETWILTNGKNFSTAGHFASIVRAHKFAKFAGTETGSTFTCNGNQEEFRLNNTGLIGTVAKSTFSTAVESMPEDQGIKVDLYIPLKKDDYLNHYDGQLTELINYLDEN